MMVFCFTPKKLILLFGIVFCIFLCLRTPTVQAASLYLSPSSGEYVVGQSFSITLGINSSDQAANAMSGVISFPADKISVYSISKSGSILNLWTQEPSYSNSNGAVSFEGIAFNPGFTGGAGKIMSISFQAKSAGTAAISFSSGLVLANDGLGTNITSGLGRATITIKDNATQPDPVIKPPAEQAKPGVPRAPAVVSPSHPDSNAWYNNNIVNLCWSPAKDVTAVSVFVDQKSNILPIASSDGLFEKYTTQSLSSGVWYFHIRVKNSAGWGPATHFRFQIDTDPPESFKTAIIYGNETNNFQPSAIFNAVDSLSGIDHYELTIDGASAFVVNATDVIGGSYDLPVLAPGIHQLVVAAVDQAGNITYSNTEFTAAPSNKPIIDQFPTRIKEGGILAIRGISKYNDALVKVWVQEEGGSVVDATVGTDGKGVFYCVVDFKMRPGVYKLWAQASDKEGNLSELSDKITIVVEKTPWLAVAGREINIWSLILPVVVMLSVFALFTVRKKLRFTDKHRVFKKNPRRF